MKVTPTLENVSPAARYIAALLLTLNFDAPMPKKPDGISYRAIFKLAKRHSIAGSLWYILEDEVRQTGDEELIARFERERELDTAKHIVQCREFDAVTRAFTEAGVDFLPLKGFLMKALWRRPEYRTMTDMDIYVSEAGIEKAATVLESLGYTFDHGGTVHDSYLKPPYVNIELHKVPGYYSQKDFPDWQKKDGNDHWHLMSPEDEYLFMVSHMYKHFFRGGGIGIRSFFDMYLFLLKNGEKLDFDYIHRDIREYGMTEFYEVAKCLISVWFEGKVDNSESTLELEYYVTTGGTFGTVENRVTYAISKKKRGGYLLSRIFIPYSSMVFIYPWLRRLPFLLPVGWVMRVMRAVFDGRARREIKAVNRAVKKQAGKKDIRE